MQPLGQLSHAFHFLGYLGHRVTAGDIGSDWGSTTPKDGRPKGYQSQGSIYYVYRGTNVKEPTPARILRSKIGVMTGRIQRLDEDDFRAEKPTYRTSFASLGLPQTAAKPLIFANVTEIPLHRCSA